MVVGGSYGMFLLRRMKHDKTLYDYLYQYIKGIHCFIGLNFYWSILPIKITY